MTVAIKKMRPSEILSVSLWRDFVLSINMMKKVAAFIRKKIAMGVVGSVFIGDRLFEGLKASNSV